MSEPSANTGSSISMILIVLAVCIITLDIPSYGELIDLYLKFEGEADIGQLLRSELCRLYPALSISRSSRFLNTVQRIVAPTRPSLLGPAKLTGSPLASYRKRTWEPRIRKTCTGNTLSSQLFYFYIYYFR